MSTLRERIWGLELTPPKREILLAMAECAGEGETCAPGVPLLNWMTGYSERQVQRILKDLEADGLISVVGGQPRFQEAFCYQIDTSNGIAKAPFIPRRKAGDKMTPLTGDKMSPPTPDLIQAGDILSPAADDKMSPPQTVSTSSHGKKADDKMSPGDTPSANLSSISLSLDQDSTLSREISEEKEKEIRARDSTPMPFHIANGLGRRAPGQTSPLVQSIEAHPAYQAFVRGWDGIKPRIEPMFADQTFAELKKLEAAIEAGDLSLKDVEEITRWKLSIPRIQGYRVNFVLADYPSFCAWKRAQKKSEDERSGQKYVTGKFAEFIEH